eukprot:g20933.t1
MLKVHKPETLNRHCRVYERFRQTLAEKDTGVGSSGEVLQLGQWLEDRGWYKAATFCDYAIDAEDWQRYDFYPNEATWCPASALARGSSEGIKFRDRHGITKATKKETAPALGTIAEGKKPVGPTHVSRMQNFASGKIPAVGKIVTTRTGAKIAVIPGHTTTGKKSAYKGR